MANKALSVRQSNSRICKIMPVNISGNRVNDYNTSFLLFTFLPYHDTSIFRNLLSILPDTIPSTFKFLGPYLKSLALPPRHTIVYSATSNDGFFAAFNKYIIKLCRGNSQHQQLLTFWAAVCVEAVSERLHLAKSGRQELQRQREEDVLIKVLPVLNDGLSLENSVELTLACYTISIVLTAKATLADKVLDRVMKAVAGSFNPQTSTAGMICLAIISKRRKDPTLPRKVVSAIQKLPRIYPLLRDMGTRYDTAPLAYGLIASCTSALEKRNSEKKIEFIHHLIENKCVPEDALPEVIGAILQAVATTAHESDSQTSSRQLLRYLIKLLRDQEPFSEALQKAVLDSHIDIDCLEAYLQITINTKGRLSPPPDIDIHDNLDPSVEDVFSTASSHLPKRTPEETSFLSARQSRLYDQMSGLFHVAIRYQRTIEMFQNLPLLRREAVPGNLLYLSFFCRVVAQDHLEAARAAAAESIASVVLSQTNSVDIQALLPYCLLSLADPVARVRRAASQIILAMSNSESVNPEAFTASSRPSELMYGPGYQKEGLTRLSAREVSRILHKVILPVLEECVLDPSQIRRALESALKGSSSSIRVNANLESIDIRKNLRSSFFGFLTDHVLHVPLYSVKIKLLLLLSNIHRVGSRYKGDELSPLLHDWASKPEAIIQDIAEAEQIEAAEIENHLANVISQADQHPAKKILSIFKIGQPLRETLKNAMYNRLISIWPLLKHEAQAISSEVLMDEGLSLEKDKEDASRFSRDVLRAVDIPSEVLSVYLEKISDSAVNQHGSSPPSKKRRISHQQQSSSSAKDSQEAMGCVHGLAFALEIIDNSEPQNRPNILKALFKALGAVHHLRTQLTSGMGYALNLALGSILSIVKHAESPAALQLDPSAIRIDQIINCVRVSEDQQVQNTALLAIANIARLAPDTVLHSVMPIFTFIGSNMSRKDDEFSVYVVDQTIDHVIPPLIQSLKDQKKDVLAGASELLSHFAAAFEHMPSHRRVRLFETLIAKLGPPEFLFAALAMLAARKPAEAQDSSFIATLTAKFSSDVQLTTCRRLLALVSDALVREPKEAQTILNINSMSAEDRHKTVLAMVQSLPSLFSQRGLGNPINQSMRGASAAASSTREALATILEQLIHLGTMIQDQDDLPKAVATAIESLLGLPSLRELILMAKKLLSHEDDELRQKTLRLVEARFATEPGTDSATQSATIEFLQVLIRIIESSSNVFLQTAAVSCIDRITERYGRKNDGSILQCAQMVASPICLGNPDERLAVVSLLCFSTMVETCKQGMIPVLPEALPGAFEQIRKSVEEKKLSTRLHSAGFSVVLSVISNLPWMISEDDIVSILSLSAESAELGAYESSEELRMEVLQIMAEKVDLHENILAVRRSWAVTASNGFKALSEIAAFLCNSIDSHSKNVVVRNSELLIDFFTLAFDLRRFHLAEATDDSYTENEIDRFEVEMHAAFLKMVYKLNDSSFRPLFQHIVEWSTDVPNSAQSTTMDGETAYRQISVFRLFTHFFATLKSLVTSYAGSILPRAAKILENTSASGDAESSTSPGTISPTLWLSTVSMLHPLLEHDQDAYFSTPSHFTTVSGALVSQLKLSANPLFNRHVITLIIPSIVSLARAVASTASHHQALNNAICTLRHDVRKEVRLASVRCQAALTEGLAEEWLENVSAEMMIYINEMLEDDDEEVEREVRSWVGQVQEILGEEIGI